MHHERAAARDSELHRDRDHLTIATRRVDHDGADWDDRGNVNDADVRKALRGLKLGDRMLLHVSSGSSLRARYSNILDCGCAIRVLSLELSILNCTILYSW
jgi:hypothetical protein